MTERSPLMAALLGLPQRAQEGADWLYRQSAPMINRTNDAINYYAGPHLSQALGNVTSLGGLLSPAGGAQDALAGSAETSRGLLGGNLSRAFQGGGEMGLGLLGMVPAMGMATKAAKVADFSDLPLAKLQRALAGELGAKKVGEGKAYNEYGRRAEGGDKSKYYRLPDGREVRISSHADINGGNSHIDLVIDPSSGEATLITNPQRGMDGSRGRRVEFSRDDPKTTLNIANEPIPDWYGFEGDGTAWTAALRKYLKGE